MSSNFHTRSWNRPWDCYDFAPAIHSSNIEPPSSFFIRTWNRPLVELRLNNTLWPSLLWDVHHEQRHSSEPKLRTRQLSRLAWNHKPSVLLKEKVLNFISLKDLPPFDIDQKWATSTASSPPLPFSHPGLGLATAWLTAIFF